jgi:hypothetical protein
VPPWWVVVVVVVVEVAQINMRPCDFKLLSSRDFVWFAGEVGWVSSFHDGSLIFLARARTKLRIPYMQSPIADLWSFYYVAQWAAVFNKTNFPAGTPVPIKLANLRRLIAGSESDRALGTRKVTGPLLDPTHCGEFLVECSSLLREWESELKKLTTDWTLAKVDSLTHGNVYDARYPYFTSLAVCRV